MRKIATALLTAAVLLAAPAAQARTKLTGEQQLAKILEGREAGKPVHCISLFDMRDLQVIDKTALVYRTGGVIYVNRPSNPEHLDSDDVLVTKLSGSQFCDLDIVHTVDRNSFFITGFISMGEFVPYRRIAKAEKAN